jgi:hypothetical protein
MKRKNMIMNLFKWRRKIKKSFGKQTSEVGRYSLKIRDEQTEEKKKGLDNKMWRLRGQYTFKRRKKVNCKE